MESSGTTTLAEPPVAADAPPAPWSAVTRFGFRVALLYFFCFCFLDGNGTLFGGFPGGNWVEGKLNWPFNHLAEFAGQHLFHLTGIAAHWHPTDSGDTAMNWIANGLFVTFAVAGGIVWTLFAQLRGSRRTEYRTLNGWLRFVLRLTCAMFMISYGMAKVFPFQMPAPSIAVLNEPAGSMAPMTFLWNLIGLNPVYETICGSAEVLGGVLLFYRRTALAGALFSAFVMTNVVLYNFCYDVPVKLFAVNLLLACMFLALPDAISLGRFFWSHRLAAATAAWVPPIRRRAGRIAIVVGEIVLAGAYLVMQPILVGVSWHHVQAMLRTPSPLTGAWHLDATHPASGAFIDPEGVAITDLYVTPFGRAYTRSSDGELWLSGAFVDAKKHTVGINCYFIAEPTNYAWQMTDANHLVLTSVAPDPPKAKDKSAKTGAPFTPAVLTLTRTPTPEHYPLLERGFHFISEWRYER